MNLARCASILSFGAVVTVHGSDWPRWLGPERNGHAAPGVALKELPSEPKSVWRVKVGEGHGGPILAGGKVIFADAVGNAEIVHALDASTGKELWQKAYAEVYRDEWGAGPRATPFADGDRLYVQSCRGDFHCLKLEDGADVWSKSFERDFGVKFLGSLADEGTAARRGNSGSGIVDGDAVIVPVGGVEGASLVCFDKLTGGVRWKAGHDEAAYSSLQVAEIAGTRQVVALLADALIGVDRADGRLLWRKPLRTNAKRHAATPVIRGDDIMVNSHTFGILCLRVYARNGEFAVEQQWENREEKINLATPVLLGESLYSQGPPGSYVCVDVATGKRRWAQRGFPQNYSSTIAVGGNLLVLTEDGQLILVASNPGKYEELGRAQVCGKTWCFPAYADGRLYVKDQRELACWELSAAP